MMNGRILDAGTQDTYVLKLVGDVRLTLSTTLEKCIQKMLGSDRFKQLVVDLSEAENIDSTSLGLLAKLSLYVQERFQRMPLLVYGSDDIYRVLVSMGFDHQVYQLVDHAHLYDMPLQEVAGETVPDPVAVETCVLEAHRVLMSLNSENERTFRDLVHALERGGC